RLRGCFGYFADDRRFGRHGDLADDLDDVAVRVPHAQLTVGPVAARQDLADPLELALRAELLRVRLDVAERAADQLRHRPPVAARGGGRRARGGRRPARPPGGRWGRRGGEPWSGPWGRNRAASHLFSVVSSR